MTFPGKLLVGLLLHAFVGTACGDAPDAARIAALWLEQQVITTECVLSAFGPWTACSRSCGGGTAMRVRSIVSTPTGGRTVCPGLRERRECNLSPCAVACRVSPWGPYSQCPVACGAKGIATRTRFVLVQPAFGGGQCPALVQLAACMGSCQPAAAAEQTGHELSGGGGAIERVVLGSGSMRRDGGAQSAREERASMPAVAVAVDASSNVRRRRADRAIRGGGRAVSAWTVISG